MPDETSRPVIESAGACEMHVVTRVPSAPFRFVVAPPSQDPDEIAGSGKVDHLAADKARSRALLVLISDGVCHSAEDRQAWLTSPPD